MTLDDLKTLLDFHYWARDRALAAAARLTPEQFTRGMGNSFNSVRDTIVHLYSADWGWYQLWHGVAPASLPSSDEFADLDAIRRAWNQHESRMRAFLDSLTDADVDRRIEIRTADGTTTMSAPIEQMVLHVVNHGSYHRGQLTMMFRQLGVEPANSMDLIRYYRERTAGGGS